MCKGSIMGQKVVITGLGVVSSLGKGKNLFWKNLLAGKTGISKVTSFDTSAYFTSYAGEIKDFNARENIKDKNMKDIGRTSQFLIAAVEGALKNAGIDEEFLRNKKCGIMLGTASGEAQAVEKNNKQWIKQGLKSIKKKNIKDYTTNILAYNLTKALEIKGIIKIFRTACAAGNYAIAHGYDLIRQGEVDIVIAAGADSFSEVMFAGFNQVGAVAPCKCQPFDKNRKGMIPAEGAGVLILESLSHAKKRKAQIYAEVLGAGFSCDAFHMTAPSSEGIARCLINSLSVARIKSTAVDYICAHGTGTISNDRAESMAIKQVFGKKIPVSSIKSHLGHSMGAASMIEAVACCLSLQQGIMPATINYETPDPECDIDCVPNYPREKKLKVIINNSFAFGGNNAAVVLGQYL